MNQLATYITKGNHKLPSSTYIFNIISATDCPAFKLGLCQMKNNCYAYADEKFRKGVLDYRRAQEKIWDRLSPQQFVDNLVEINDQARTKKVELVRFQESGDFRDQNDIDKMMKIANLLGPYGIRCYTYTARRDLDYTRPHHNLIINGSNFMVDNMYKIVQENNKNEYWCSGDCSVCNYCYTNGNKIITAKLRHRGGRREVK